MPLGVKPECAKCGARETPLWHATDTGNFCNSCLEEEKSNVGDCGSGMTRTDEEDERSGSRASRKSTRITRYCKPKNSGTGGTSLGGTSGSNNNNNNNINGNSNNSNDTGGNNHNNNNNNNDNNHSYNNNNHNCNNNNGHSSNNTNNNSTNNNNNNSTIVAKSVPKGRGRRHIFKKMPIKAPAATATPVTSNFVFYKGTYFQVGDIVSLQDVNGKTYYAQIRGLLTDQYCEKSAAITWLLPTTSSPPPEEGFIPETYILGPEEDLPRKLEYMEFVMHSPSDYYKLKNSPYPPPLTETGSGYIWTTLRNEMMSFRK